MYQLDASDRYEFSRKKQAAIEFMKNPEKNIKKLYIPYYLTIIRLIANEKLVVKDLIKLIYDLFYIKQKTS